MPRSDVPALAVLASRVRVEERRILDALDRRSVTWRHLDPRRLWWALDDLAPTYAVVLNREIAQVRSLCAARMLEAAGITVLNPAGVIEVCGDKVLTSLALRRAGVPTPRTAVALTPEAGLDALSSVGLPAVIKPVTGSWGRLAALVRDGDAAQAVLEHRQALPSPQQHIIYLQEHVPKPGRDIRVLLLGDEPLAASYRSAAEWRTNGARGAQFSACSLDEDIAGLARQAARAVGGGMLAVDLLEGRGGELLVLEVNHTPEFSGLQSVHPELDIADAMVSYVLAQICR